MGPVGSPLKSVHYMLQCIDVKKAVINLASCQSDLDANSIADVVPEDSARYHLFSFKHTHEGDYKEAVGEESGLSWVN